MTNTNSASPMPEVPKGQGLAPSVCSGYISGKAVEAIMKTLNQWNGDNPVYVQIGETKVLLDHIMDESYNGRHGGECIIFVGKTQCDPQDRHPASGKIASKHEEAVGKYLEYVQAYEEAEANAVSSFYEHNQASYWKGRRDALRDILANVASEGQPGGRP